MKKKGKKMVPNCVPEEYVAEAAKPPRWKKAGPNGEKEITFSTGRRFKIEKQLDHNERHKGEWKVMEWDSRSRDWEWHDTFSPQWYAKEKVMELGKYDQKGKKISEHAGYWGTSELADRYARETPGQKPMKTHKNKYKEPKANKMKDE